MSHGLPLAFPILPSLTSLTTKYAALFSMIVHVINLETWFNDATAAFYPSRFSGKIMQGPGNKLFNGAVSLIAITRHWIKAIKKEESTFRTTTPIMELSVKH